MTRSCIHLRRSSQSSASGQGPVGKKRYEKFSLSRSIRAPYILQNSLYVHRRASCTSSTEAGETAAVPMVIDSCLRPGTCNVGKSSWANVGSGRRVNIRKEGKPSTISSCANQADGSVEPTHGSICTETWAVLSRLATSANIACTSSSLSGSTPLE